MFTTADNSSSGTLIGAVGQVIHWYPLEESDPSMPSKLHYFTGDAGEPRHILDRRRRDSRRSIAALIYVGAAVAAMMLLYWWLVWLSPWH